MTFNYIIKGITLSEPEMREISKFYQAACTGEYLQEIFRHLHYTDEEAIKHGYAVREIMSKYEMNENDAINHYYHNN